MNRRKLWELPCTSRDLILWTSFGCEELRDIARRVGFALELPVLAGSPDPTVPLRAGLHRACDGPNDLSERIQEILDDVHKDAILRVAVAPCDDVLEWVGAPLHRLPLSLAGLAWAVATDPRDPMRILESALAWRLSAEGLQALAFGKVELIEVDR